MKPTKNTLQMIFKAAEQHANNTGEAEMQVGDLEDVIRAAWRIMSDEQRQQLLDSEEVVDLLPEDDEDEE